MAVPSIALRDVGESLGTKPIEVSGPGPGGGRSAPATPVFVKYFGKFLTQGLMIRNPNFTGCSFPPN